MPSYCFSVSLRTRTVPVPGECSDKTDGDVSRLFFGLGWSSCIAQFLCKGSRLRPESCEDLWRLFLVPRLFVGSSITRILINYFLFLYSIHDTHRQEGREQQPCKHNCSDYCISQHCISVIQATVDRIIISSVQSGVQIVEIFFCCICFINIYIGNI